MAETEDDNSDDGLDEELQNLLNDLDEEKAENPEPPELVEPPEAVEAVEQPIKPIPVKKPKLTKPGAPTVAPDLSTKKESNDPPPAQSNGNLDQLTGKFHKVFDKLLKNLDDDRAEMDNFISVYALQTQSDSPKQSFVEGLVQLIGTKAKASSDAVKLLDTAAKMLAASKSIALSGPGATTPKGELDRLMDDIEFDPNAP